MSFWTDVSDGGHRSGVSRRRNSLRSVDQELRWNKTMERSTTFAPRRNFITCATRPKPLHCDGQRMQKRWTMAARAVSAQRGAESEDGAPRHHLQRRDKRVREGRAMAAGVGAAGRISGIEAEARRLGYSAGISACGKSEQWQWALTLLSEMLEVKLEPN
ncbi:unnamed protein product [Prorocentrum cordatum]|uniref:Uncharacterized protein n=1 Tax=Prorocentrum cordatum TaxID=2364126 RepID=A0ABN9RCI9_9DINO|nr:unnamed protein product [Polarella glacialis]